MASLFNYYHFVYGVSDILMDKNVGIGDYLSELRLQIDGCQKCPLSENRNKIVFGEGNHKADLMFIGEGPGAEEDKQGIPFVGRAGQLLTKMIKAMGLERDDVYITNIVKCRPPANRAPFRDEVSICIPYLRKQIKQIKPSVIVCLGSIAVSYLLNSNSSIGKVRGKFVEYESGIKVMPTYHPAYLLRNPSMKREVWEDLKMVMAELNLK